ncbi:hypothetical protein COS51_05185 [Candidatus Roizmanbacteria bacterium CG03_land_8_20_14_0_80_36_21]|nr:MAG: hypothetical protein COS51_05185 [Candidatus Roizmanbacteria bacterium CG03_land_8_20_14_0_80_36_21]
MVSLSNKRYEKLGDFDFIKHPDVSPGTKKLLEPDLEFIKILVDTPANKWEKMHQRMAELINGERLEGLFLSADILCREKGLDLEKDFLSPLKQFEMGIGYDPHVATLDSRAAGTQIPFPLRALVGNLRFARQVLAQGSLASAVTQEYQYILTTHAYFMNVIKTELEKAFKVKLELEKRNFVLKEENLEGINLDEFFATNPVIQNMCDIVMKDYNQPELIYQIVRTAFVLV